MKKIINKILNFDVYASLYLMLAFAYAVPFTKIYAEKLIKVFVIWTIFLVIKDLLTKKRILKDKTTSLLVLFVCSMGLSIVSNIGKYFIPNIYVIVYAFTQIVTMFIIEDKKNIDKRIINFSKIFIIITFILSIVSFWMFQHNLQIGVDLGIGHKAPVGTYEGRLWGVYGNPNALAAYSVVSIMFSIVNINMFIKNIKENKGKILFNVANIILQLLVGSLGNSRSALVGIMVFCIFIYHSFKYNFYLDEKIKKCKKIFTFIGMTILIMISIFFLNNSIKDVSLTLAKVSNTISNKLIGEINLKEDDEEELKIDREYGDQDVSNGRLSIWNAAIHVFAKNPFGVTQKALNEEMNKFMPADILAKSKTLTSSTHNIYLQILVAYGIITFCIFIYIFVNMFIKYLNKLKTSNGSYKKSIILYGAITAFYLSVNFFDSVLFETLSLPMCLSAWFSFGILNSILNYNAKEK